MSTLYHYCNASSFASIIGERKIWLSSLSLSNDTMEGKVVRATFQNLLEKSQVSGTRAESVLDAVKKLEEIVDGLGFCLSCKGDLLSQWRGYSDDGRGFSLGFSTDYLKELPKNKEEGEQGFSLQKVVYDPEEQENALRPIFDRIMADVQAGKLDMPRPLGLLSAAMPESQAKFERDKEAYFAALKTMMLNVFSAMFHLFTLKGQAFQEEQEWRLISYLSKDDDSDCDFRASGNRLVPYRSFDLKALNMPAINEVILGPKNETPEFVVGRFLEKKGFGQVEVRRSTATYR